MARATRLRAASSETPQHAPDGFEVLAFKESQQHGVAVGLRQRVHGFIQERFGVSPLRGGGRVLPRLFDRQPARGVAAGSPGARHQWPCGERRGYNQALRRGIRFHLVSLRARSVKTDWATSSASWVNGPRAGLRIDRVQILAHQGGKASSAPCRVYCSSNLSPRAFISTSISAPTVQTGHSFCPQTPLRGGLFIAPAQPLILLFVFQRRGCGPPCPAPAGPLMAGRGFP